MSLKTFFKSRVLVKSLFTFFVAKVSSIPIILVTCFWSPHSHSEEVRLKSENQIIKSLGPYSYLPEHAGKKRSIDLFIPFALGKATLRLSAELQLRELARALKQTPLQNSVVLIIGHTDATGSKLFNLRLSSNRAKAVKDFLVQEEGLHRDRFFTRGLGEEDLKNPLVPDSPVNRRVEVQVMDKVFREKKMNKIDW